MADEEQTTSIKRRRIMVLMHEALLPPETMDGVGEDEIVDWKTEFDVVNTLQNMGHDVIQLGLYDDLGVIRRAMKDHKPHIAFNLLEEFHGVAVYDHHVVSYLELMKQPYTGCNPRGILLANDKPLSKKILTYHRIRTPKFQVFPRKRKTNRLKSLKFPLLVKSASEDASLGISQASIVYDDEKLKERVEFVHQRLETDALVESYIDGREVYVSILGNRKLQVFPIWELLFKNAPEGMPQIATARVKWDGKYQKKLGIETRPAELPRDVERKIIATCKKTYRALGLSGYARIDLRINSDNEVYVLEANPNPNLSYGEDFAESAHQSGIDYEQLLQKIIGLGLSYQAEWRS